MLIHVPLKAEIKLGSIRMRNVSRTGIHIAEPDVILKWQERGMTMLGCNTDLGVFAAGASKTLAALKQDKVTPGKGAANIHV